MTKTCSASWVTGSCDRPSPRRTYCPSHYRQHVRGGDFKAIRPRKASGAGKIRNSDGEKQCNRCCRWLSEQCYTKNGMTSDRLNNWCRECQSEWSRLARYGIDNKQLMVLLAAQGDSCAICKRGYGEIPDGWHVDHDHRCCDVQRTCGKCVRGVLCGPCNKMIGLARDSVGTLRNAITYLEHYHD